jgi:hypothetical protein
MEILEIKTKLEILDRAIPAIKKIVKHSTHQDPILAVFWHGSSGEIEPHGGKMGPTIWHWGVMTHEHTILDPDINIFSPPYILKWKNKGFTFYTQTKDIETAKSQLDFIKIDSENGKAKCYWKGGNHEAITSIEMPNA